jgi:general secretion pathway protein C
MKTGDKLNIRKLLLISKLALVAILAYTVFKTVMIPQRSNELFTPKSAIGTGPMYIEGPITAPENQTHDYSIITDRNIFGTKDLPPITVSSSQNTASLNPLEVVKTLPGFELLGTVVGGDSLSRAIIRNIVTNIVGPYKTNDTIDGASIVGIEQDRVVFNKQGQTKILTIGTQTTAPTETIAPPPAPSNSKIPEPNTVEVPVKVEPQAAIQTKLKYIQAILKKAALKPNMVGNKMQGLRITQVDNVPFAKTIGLRNGDVIRAVNGQSLTSKQKAFQVFRKAKSKPSMKVELMRGNETKTLLFDLR